MEGRRYIAVEGVLGSGKSLFARALAESMKGRFVADAASSNPFLDNYYKNPRDFAFATQIFYLLNRFRQQQELMQVELFSGATVTDFLFERDRIFAYLSLSDSELAMYEQLYKVLTREPLPQPDLVVYLQLSADPLAGRLEKRGLLKEKGGMSREVLEQVVKAYTSFFHNYSDSALLIVNMGDLDLEQSSDVSDLVERVKQTYAGTHYYTPKK